MGNTHFNMEIMRMTLGDRWKAAVESGKLQDAEAIAREGEVVESLKFTSSPLSIDSIITNNEDIADKLFKHVTDSGYTHWAQKNAFGVIEFPSTMHIALDYPDNDYSFMRELMAVARTDPQRLMMTLTDDVINCKTRRPSDLDGVRVLREEGIEFTKTQPLEFGTWTEGEQVWNQAKPKSAEISNWGLSYASTNADLTDLDFFKQMVETALATGNKKVNVSLSEVEENKIRILELKGITIEF